MSEVCRNNDAAKRPVFERRRAGNPLSGFVSEFWYWRGYSLPRTTERILPLGTVELVIDLSSSRLSDSVVFGPHSQPFLIDRIAEHELVGVHFNPGGAYPFLRTPYSGLHNCNVCIADVWSTAKAEQLISHLLQAKSVVQKLSLLELWLTNLAVRPLQHHPVVADALDAFTSKPNAHSSATLADSANLSQRHFIQLFRDEVGLPPKLFCRIRRFHDVIARIGKRDVVGWTDVVEANGYYDQAHFNHDFREFCGLTPSQYLEQRIKGDFAHVRVSPD